MEGVRVIASMAGIFLVIAAAYYVTYFISAKAQGMTRARAQHQHIKLISRFAIARDKSFCIVEIAGSVYIVAVTNNTMTLLDKLDSAAFAEFAAESGEVSVWPAASPGSPFAEFLKLAKDKTGQVKDKFTPKRTKQEKQDKDAGEDE